jgi:hypothetical protein
MYLKEFDSLYNTIFGSYNWLYTVTARRARIVPHARFISAGRPTVFMHESAILPESMNVSTSLLVEIV